MLVRCGWWVVVFGIGRQETEEKSRHSAEANIAFVTASRGNDSWLPLEQDEKLTTTSEPGRRALSGLSRGPEMHVVKPFEK